LKNDAGRLKSSTAKSTGRCDLKKSHRMETYSPRVRQIVSRMKSAGYRITPQRLAILRQFADSRSHPSVEKVYEAVKPDFPTTSLATVYKTVNLLKVLREALEIGFGDDCNRYDVRLPEPHPHLVCLKCRCVLDADIEPLSHLTESLSTATGFQILSHRVDFYGICPDCRDSEHSSTAKLDDA
jgi:Fur family transcriptional regulator, peroxide stress response regulator